MFRNKTYEAYPNTTLKKQLMSMINPTSLITVKSITLFHGYHKRKKKYLKKNPIFFITFSLK